MSASLQGKRVVLLGGTSGFGFATAEAASREGAAVVVASSRRERVDRALERLPQGSEGHVLDLTSETQIQQFFHQVGPFDHLVYTAGDSLRLGSLASITLEDARRFFDTRYWGAFMAAKYGSPSIRPGGSITLTSGTAGLRPRKGWSVASSVVGAVEGLTRALAVELAPLRVNAVCAGPVRTELWDSLNEQDREALFQQYGTTLPVGRIGEAAELAEAYLYLMRESFSTGQIIVVDGGGLLV